MSLEVGLLALVAALNTNIDVIILGSLTNASIVADYKMHNFTVFVVTFFATTYCLILANRLGATSHSMVLTYFRSNLSHTTTLTLIYVVLTSLICLGLLPSFVHFWTKGEYLLSTFSILPFIISGGLISFNSYFVVVFIHLNVQNKIIPFLIGGLTCNIVMNIILIPKFGMLGASVSTAIANFLTLLVSFYFYSRLIKDIK